MILILLGWAGMTGRFRDDPGQFVAGGSLVRSQSRSHVGIESGLVGLAVSATSVLLPVRLHSRHRLRALNSEATIRPHLSHQDSLLLFELLDPGFQFRHLGPS